MSKEGMKKFLERASTDSMLKEKLSRLKGEDGTAVLALARKAGFEVTYEDLSENPQCLGDEDLEAVSGGWNPFPFGKGLRP